MGKVCARIFEEIRQKQEEEAEAAAAPEVDEAEEAEWRKCLKQRLRKALQSKAKISTTEKPRCENLGSKSEEKKTARSEGKTGRGAGKGRKGKGKGRKRKADEVDDLEDEEALSEAVKQPLQALSQSSNLEVDAPSTPNAFPAFQALSDLMNTPSTPSKPATAVAVTPESHRATEGGSSCHQSPLGLDGLMSASQELSEAEEGQWLEGGWVSFDVPGVWNEEVSWGNVGDVFLTLG